MGALAEDARTVGIVVDGEAGIGKTTLWLGALELVQEAWFRVLRCRPSEAEQELPFAALGDLVEPLFDSAFGELPAIQRDALDVALQRTRGVEPATRLAVSRAVLALLREQAMRGRVLVAIDDVQWLDRSTADVLSFALRRLEGLPVRLLIARRSETVEPLPLGLDRAPFADDLARLRVGPMTLDELGGLLRGRLALRLPRPRLAELHASCAGNPFYALEIGRALRATGSREDGEPLPVPESLNALLARRLDTLPQEARLATLLAAASPQPTAGLVERAAGDSDGLALAVAAGVLEATGERLRFTHPLLASTIYSAAPPWERREIHARLASAADGALERAHHLARSAVDPDEGVATELAAAATEAAARGAPETAGSLLERAAELTPRDRRDEWRSRLVDAAQNHLNSGDPARSRAILELLAGSLPPGRDRADVLWKLADVGEDFATSIELCEQALAEAGADLALTSQIHVMLATLTWVTGDVPRAVGHSRAAVESAGAAGNELVEALAIGDLSYRLMMLGQPYPQAELERAVEIETRYDGFPAFQRPSFQLGLIFAYTDRPDEARPLLRAELERLVRAGNDSWQIGVLLRLADVELRSGNWAEAAGIARRSVDIGLSAGIAQERAIGHMIHGLVQAHLGRLAEADRAARIALSLCAEAGDAVYAARSRAVLGFVELSRGNPRAALDHLGPATEELRRMDVGELSLSQVVQNEIDALVALDLLDEAEDTIALVEAKGRPTGRAWHEAVAARGRALVAAARGELDEAHAHVARALAAHERLPQPFELGRTLLAQGTIERRAKRRGEARRALTAALEVFDQLGAPRWAEKAVVELARIPGRGRADGELSETERRVAELVGSGLSNKEVAAKLFVTVRTVEGNLTRVYRKLGVHSRTELVARLNRGAGTPRT